MTEIYKVAASNCGLNIVGGLLRGLVNTIDGFSKASKGGLLVDKIASAALSTPWEGSLIIVDGPQQDSYGVSGWTVDLSDNRLSDVVISFSSPGKTYSPETTSGSGYWSKDGLTGQVTITPGSARHSFTPQSVTVEGSDIITFVGTPLAAGYALSGKVTDSGGIGMGGVAIRFTNFPFTATTEYGTGAWSQSGFSGRTTVSANKDGYVFSPQTVQVEGQRNNINFVGTAQAPLKPVNLVAEARGTEFVYLKWENQSSYTEGFEIFRRAAAEEEFTRIATLAYGDDPTLENRFNVTGDTTYYYKVRGYHGNQYSPFSQEACATTVLAPTNFSVQCIGPAENNLAWENTSLLPHTVHIERRAEGGDWQLLDIAINAEQYSDRSIEMDTAYWYRLRASIDSGGLSDYTEEVYVAYTYTASGRILNGEYPVPSARVAAVGEACERSVFTGKDGTWQMDNIRGPVTVHVEKPGYVFYPVIPGRQDLSDTATDVDFYASYRLAGFVRDVTGRRIGGAGISYSCLGTEIGGTVYSQADGSWFVAGLKGMTRLTVSKDGYTFIPETKETHAAADNLVFVARPAANYVNSIVLEPGQSFDLYNSLTEEIVLEFQQGYEYAKYGVNDEVVSFNPSVRYNAQTVPAGYRIVVTNPGLTPLKVTAADDGLFNPILNSQPALTWAVLGEGESLEYRNTSSRAVQLKFQQSYEFAQYDEEGAVVSFDPSVQYNSRTVPVDWRIVVTNPGSGLLRVYGANNGAFNPSPSAEPALTWAVLDGGASLEYSNTYLISVLLKFSAAHEWKIYNIATGNLIDSGYSGTGVNRRVDDGTRLIITNPGISLLKVYGANNGFFTPIMR